jgi:hypothetical protein
MAGRTFGEARNDSIDCADDRRDVRGTGRNIRRSS